MKIIQILIDGIGDLQKQTALQQAQIPTMDDLSKSGIFNKLKTGLACGSDTAHMSIFSYNPFKHYKGRGSFETIGSGIAMDFDEIGFKCNFSLMQGSVVTKRRADRDFDKWGLELIDSINGMVIPEYPNYQIFAKHATEHRLGLKIKGPNLNSDIIGTDPLKDNLNLLEALPVDNDNKDQILTCNIVNALSRQIHLILEQHPLTKQRKEQNLPYANIILLRGCGSRITVDSFQKKQGLKGFMVAPTAIIKGLGMSIELDDIEVIGATGDYHSNFIAKADACVQHIQQNYDYAFIHIKAVDDCGHDKNFDLKIKFLEQIDQMILHLLQNLPQDQNFVISITGDHTTPCVIGDHTFEPVPILITTLQNYLKESEMQDQVQHFNEIECAQGILGRFPASQLMELLKKI